MNTAHTFSDTIIDGLIIFTIIIENHDIPRLERHVEPFDTLSPHVIQTPEECRKGLNRGTIQIGPLDHVQN